jgi:hypothetical protein
MSKTWTTPSRTTVIWRAAQLMLKRYGDKAFEKSVARANELALAGDVARRPGAGSCRP